MVAGVLAVATMAYSSAYYLPTLAAEFPRYLVAVIIYFGSATCLAFVIIPKAVVRALADVAAAATVVWCLATGPLFNIRVPDYLYFLGQDHAWKVVAQDGVPVEV